MIDAVTNLISLSSKILTFSAGTHTISRETVTIFNEKKNPFAILCIEIMFFNSLC